MRWLKGVRTVLGPVLLVQGRRLTRTALRMPEAAGERSGTCGDGKVLKLLFVGDSSMAGVGVADQASALAGPTAALVAEGLGCAVEWQMIGRSGATTGQLVQLLDDARLEEPDVLITASGANDVIWQTGATEFTDSYGALLGRVFGSGRRRLAVVSGLPPLHATPAVPQPLRWYLGAYARALDRRLMRWTEHQAGTSYLSLQWAADGTKLAEDRFHPGAELYRTWAGLVAAEVVGLEGIREAARAPRQM